MELILYIIGGLIGLRVLFGVIISTILYIRKVRMCTVPLTAEILSWRIEEDSDNPTQCLPSIRYSCQGRVYETVFWDGMVTLYEKEHFYNGDTLSIFADPEDPSVITPGKKGQTIWRSVESCIVVMLLCLFLILICIVGVCSCI